MSSYTEEQKRRAVETVEECGGSVTRAMRKLGYPTRQTLYPLRMRHGRVLIEDCCAKCGAEVARLCD